MPSRGCCAEPRYRVTSDVHYMAVTSPPTIPDGTSSIDGHMLFFFFWKQPHSAESWTTFEGESYTPVPPFRPFRPFRPFGPFMAFTNPELTFHLYTHDIHVIRRRRSITLR